MSEPPWPAGPTPRGVTISGGDPPARPPHESSAQPEHEGRVGAARRPRRRPGAWLPGQAVGPGGGSAERRRHLLEPGEGGPGAAGGGGGPGGPGERGPGEAALEGERGCGGRAGPGRERCRVARAEPGGVLCRVPTAPRGDRRGAALPRALRLSHKPQLRSEDPLTLMFSSRGAEGLQAGTPQPHADTNAGGADFRSVPFSNAYFSVRFSGCRPLKGEEIRSVPIATVRNVRAPSGPARCALGGPFAPCRRCPALPPPPTPPRVFLAVAPRTAAAPGGAAHGLSAVWPSCAGIVFRTVFLWLPAKTSDFGEKKKNKTKHKPTKPQFQSSVPCKAFLSSGFFVTVLKTH